MTAPAPHHRLVDVTLDAESIGHGNSDIEHEREVAIFDLTEDNVFSLAAAPERGPFKLHLSIAEARLVFSVSDESGQKLTDFMLSLTPFRRLVKDYFLVLDSYHAAIRTSTLSRIEAIDMGRRGLHDEASRLLVERLAGKIETDFATARRLFTLICALHWKG
jgi:uncharacterized protein (UPF0262 family)